MIVQQQNCLKPFDKVYPTWGNNQKNMKIAHVEYTSMVA